MAPDDDFELPQTQSQSQNIDDQINFSETSDNGQDHWGQLVAKHESFKDVVLTHDKLTVGRATSCDYSLQNPPIKQKLLIQMSKLHFQITRDLTDDSPAIVEDLSRNGTFINGDKIGTNKKRILAHGDMISIINPKFKIFYYRDHRRIKDCVLPEQISKKFYLGRKLGSGACGTVFLVHEHRTCNMYALKHIEKKQLVADKSLNEARIMRTLTHPCIIKMHELFNTKDALYITLELMKGGELLRRIQKMRHLSETNSKIFFYQMCHAIKYLHDSKITHRDLKPDNILLASSEENTLLKISDFGLSKLVRNDSVLRTLCGTPLYVAPEVLLTNGKGEYTEKVDIWSLGVVLFTMLNGTLPFADDYGTPATEQIKHGRFHFRSSNWAKVSNTAKQLIRGLLTTDVEKRPSINQLLKHKWLTDYSMISTAHKIMNLPLPKTYETVATRMALNAPQCSADSTTSGVFARPYKVDVESENVQSSQRRRLR